MNQTQVVSPSLPVTAQCPVCRVVPLGRVPGAKRDELAVCRLPGEDSPEQLMAAFRAAPQFSQISVETLLKQKGNLRVVLLGEKDYYLRQAAVYLTAMSRKQSGGASAPPVDDFWSDLDLDECIQETSPDFSAVMKESVAVVAPSMLDPAIGQGEFPAGKTGAAAQGMQMQKQVDLNSLDSAGVLIAASSGKVLSEGVLDSIGVFLEQEEPQNLFVAVKPSQIELDLLEELRFTYGFRVCRVGQVDQSYLRRLLTQLAEDMGVTLSSEVDLDKVIAQLCRYRGAAFAESDFGPLLQRAAQRKGKLPLQTEDLLIRPCRAQGSHGREALQAMVGLTAVKEAMSRLLASAALEDRRRMNGVEIPPSCRNLAFSGQPGTGKSVTARLAAQILREEGCGTGRFVEAGREQLIGAYLGHTSPMIAELFRKAKGGVLFIDEAGALLDSDGHDSYAAEAVNALVRHMELEPETMVIFATYPEEMKKLLSSNPGLSSRVAQVLHFPDYGKDDLFAIFQGFAEKEQLSLPEQASDVCSSFFSALKQRKGKDFGNGREARRLFQAAKEEMALRAVTDPGVDSALSVEDLRGAARRLLEQERGGASSANPIGFAV